MVLKQDHPFFKGVSPVKGESGLSRFKNFPGKVGKLSEAYYLFCFTRNELVDDEALGFGLTEAQPLVKITVGDLAAIVSLVSLEEYTGPGSEERLSNVEWITPRALRHGQVIQEIAEIAPVLPSSFGALFSGQQRVISLIKKNYEAIAGFLSVIQDKEEWAVKAYLDRDKLKNLLFRHRVEKLEPKLSELSPGLRYFREKQVQAEIEKEIASWVNERIDRIAIQLTNISKQILERKNTKLDFDGNKDELVSNWAILTLKDDFEKITELISKMNMDPDVDGLELKLSGPWPPYTFAPPLEMETEK